MKAQLVRLADTRLRIATSTAMPPGLVRVELATVRSPREAHLYPGAGEMPLAR